MTLWILTYDTQEYDDIPTIHGVTDKAEVASAWECLGEYYVAKEVTLNQLCDLEYHKNAQSIALILK